MSGRGRSANRRPRQPFIERLPAAGYFFFAGAFLAGAFLAGAFLAGAFFAAAFFGAAFFVATTRPP